MSSCLLKSITTFTRIYEIPPDGRAIFQLEDRREFVVQLLLALCWHTPKKKDMKDRRREFTLQQLEELIGSSWSPTRKHEGSRMQQVEDLTVKTKEGKPQPLNSMEEAFKQAEK